MSNKIIKPLWITVACLGWFWLLYRASQDVLRIRQETGSLKAELVLFGVLAAGTLALVWLLLRLLGAPVLRPLARIQARLGWVGYWLGVLALLVAVTIFLAYSQYGTATYSSYVRWVLFVSVAIGVACLQPHTINASFHWPAYLGGMVVFGTLLAFGADLQSATSYPFQLYWSEGNRFWDYSVLFGRRLYLYPSDQPLTAFIDLGRQALWGLPFLFSDLTIQQMRVWSVLVFTVPYVFLGWFIFRSSSGRWGYWLLLGLWSLLFLNQGPIYTPLVLCAILVVAGRKLPFWLNLVLVALAGYYAQITRYTWMFAPAIWAALIAFLDVQPGQVSSARRRWLRAIAVAAAGLFGGFLAPRIWPWLQSLLQNVQSGGPVEEGTGLVSMVTRQPLLWERLLPSPTNPLGILPGLLLAAGPLLFLVLVWSLPRCSGQDLWQKLALIVTLILFLAVGLVASVKIGGGNNLHNLDMFLVGLLIVAGIAWESGADRWLVKRKGSSPWMVLPFVLLVLYPTSQIFTGTYPHNVPDPIVVSEALDSIRAKVGAAQQCGEVLFIDNRQLLTFKYLTGVRLVPEYEKKLMMDYAMANNAAYFQPFYRDLARRRFAMIVTEPLRTDYQGGSFEFGNENDAWVKWVSLPVLQSYTPYETLEQVGVQLLVPKDNPCTALPR